MKKQIPSQFDPQAYAIEAGNMSAREIMQQFQSFVRSFTYLEYRHEIDDGLHELNFKIDILKREIIDRMSIVKSNSFF